MKLYPFESQQLTIKQIHLMVPFYSETTIIKHMKEGRRTVRAISEYVAPKKKPGPRQQFVITGETSAKLSASGMR